MAVRPNNFTAKTAKGKAATVNALVYPGPGNHRGTGVTREALSKSRLASEWLREFYRANPKRLKKLMMSAIAHAEAGHARFAEIILDRLEGPVKREDAPGDTYNFNFISDAERERAKGIVDDILAMDAKTITLPELPEEIHVSDESADSGSNPS